MDDMLLKKLEYTVFKHTPTYRRFTNFAMEYVEENKNCDKLMVPIDTIKTSLGTQHNLTKTLPIPNKIISPWTIT